MDVFLRGYVCKKLTYFALRRQDTVRVKKKHGIVYVFTIGNAIIATCKKQKQKRSQMAKHAQNKVLANVFLFQGAYFVITGIWPILNMASFITATGPKQDTWLVEMVGLLSTSIGLTYLVASLRKQRLPIVLGYAASVSFLIMDVTYVASRVISRIYLLDAAIQCLFLGALTFFLLKDRSANGKLQR